MAIQFPVMMYKGQHGTSSFQFKGADNQDQYDALRNDGWYNELRSAAQIKSKLKEIEDERTQHRNALIEKCIDYGVGSREELQKMSMEELLDLSDAGKDSDVFQSPENGEFQ